MTGHAKDIGKNAKITIARRATWEPPQGRRDKKT